MMMLPLLFATMTIPLPSGFQPQAIAVGSFGVALCGDSGQLLIVGGPPQTATCGEHPTSMIANGNDLVVANHDTDYITYLRNDGHARFTSQTLHVHSKPHPHTVAAADVNHDGRIDLITDSWGENRLTLLLANGSGWQTPGTPIDVGRKPYINVMAADFDGDGNIDLVVPNSGFNTVTVLFGDGRGHFRAEPPIAAGPTPFDIAVADFNGDGRPDIVVANYSGHMTDTSRDGLTWVRNDGHRHFTAFPQRLATGVGVWRVAAGDLNGDGIADAAFVNGGEDTVTIAFGSKNGLRPGPKIKVMPHPHNLAIGNGRLFVITEERDELVEVELLAGPAAHR
jgi:hypothetical protein